MDTNINSISYSVNAIDKNVYIQYNEVVKAAPIIDGVYYRTPSPFPERDYYNATANERLWVRLMPLYIRSYSFIQKKPITLGYSFYKSVNTSDPYIMKKVPDFDTFILVSFSVIKYNNPNIDFETFQKVCFGFLRWKINKEADVFFDNDFKFSLINKVFHSDVLSTILKYKDDMFINGYPIDYKKHWYSDYIEFELSGKEKTLTKKAALGQHSKSVIIQNLIDVTSQYRDGNFGAYPTVKDLVTNSGYSRPTVKKYCAGLIVDKKCNTYLRMLGFLILVGMENTSKTKLAAELNIDRSTVHSQWDEVFREYLVLRN